MWRQYSQRTYFCGWIACDRKEVFRFITWTNSLCGICGEVLDAQRALTHGVKTSVRSRRHDVQAWDGRRMVTRRFY